MDMEVAGHWRREWAGTAEFGNVTEGGVTRRVARAMEVLHTSAPGTKVRVMRAAYHSTAGPGTPASSFLLHSSRRVISSGFNFMDSPSITNKAFEESPSTPIKPLEISSMPLDNTNIENPNYKVTEPDDTEISEPSKWKGSTSAGSLRFPSEESSSADNASIVDLDWKRRGSHRKSSVDSESSDFHTKRNSIDIPIRLSSPTSLSTLKFKSLLNGQQSDWNNRRKSYSFEDTSPLNETIVQSNDTLAMESSTDSGICKSTELVNDPVDTRYSRDQSDDLYDRHQGSFKDWLSKNRRNSYEKSNRSPFRENEGIKENSSESNIALRSQGKVTITLPITLEKDEENSYKNKANDDRERRVKRVEFCKTELHFAADSGKVNIIATDDKPPPSNDFRKRRSAFVPLNENFDKPITLFGDKNKDIFNTNNNLFINASNIISIENDENTAATKSILKNKIPKPKPYLLGENMDFGVSDELINKENTSTESIVPSAVLLINRQLQAGRTTMPEEDAVASNLSKIDYSHFRTINDGPVRNNKVSSYRSLFEREKQIEVIQKNTSSVPKSPSPIKNKFTVPPLSPIPGRAHTRQLRNSDLIYFGVNKDENKIHNETHADLYSLPAQDEDLFESVKLVRKISSSVCNSEAESEDTPEYINISYKSNFAPVPAPRTSKLMDIAETNGVESRRSRSRRSAENSNTSRSISEPPKFGRNSLERANRRRHQKNLEISSSRAQNTDETRRVNEVIHEDEDPTSGGKVSPLYANINIKNEYNDSFNTKMKRTSAKQSKSNANIDQARSVHSPQNKDFLKNTQNTAKKDNDKQCSPDRKQLSVRRPRQRTEKLVTPEHSDEKHQSNNDVRNSIRHKRSSGTHNSVDSRRKERETNKVTNNNSVTSTNKTISKRNSKNNEVPAKDVPRRENKESVDRNKTSRIIDRSPSATRKITSYDNTSNDTGRRSTTSRVQEKYSATKNPEEKRNKYKSSEYVINYDDKNGTVSSICKVTPPPTVHSITKRHKIKEAKDKTKVSDKISLLQLPDPDWTQEYYSSHTHTNRKSKKKIHIQRSCQLL